MTTTDQNRGRPPSNRDGQQPHGPRRPRAGWVFAPSLAAFFAALALLAFQVRAGQDPALGSAEPTAQAQVQPRRVLIRRVIERVVIHHPRTTGASGPPPSSPAAVQTPAPQTTTPAPAPAAPAPLTTQSS